MRHKLLGRSGLRVSELCLGTMTFGGGNARMPSGSTDEESRQMFDMFAEAGGTFVDTARAYGRGRSEELLGDFLQADRDHFVVATKYTNSAQGGLMSSGNSRRNMMLSVEKSLSALRTDRIDLLWLHVWDYTTSIEEVMRGFDDLVRAGKVLYVGFSNTPAWQVARANMLADLRGMSAAVAIQVQHNLIERSSAHDLLPMARALDLGVTAWSPLAGGLLARKPQDWDKGLRSAAPPSDHARAIMEAVDAIADELDVAPAAVATAALMQSPADQQVFPIIGARTPGHLADSLAAATVELSAEHMKRLNELSLPAPIVPYGMIDSRMAREIITGGEPERLINHRRAGR